MYEKRAAMNAAANVRPRLSHRCCCAETCTGSQTPEAEPFPLADIAYFAWYLLYFVFCCDRPLVTPRFSVGVLRTATIVPLLTGASSSSSSSSHGSDLPGRETPLRPPLLWPLPATAA